MNTLALNRLWSYLQASSMSYGEMVWLRNRIDQALEERHPKKSKSSNRVEWLRKNPIKLTPQDLADERTQYILNK